MREFKMKKEDYQYLVNLPLYKKVQRTVVTMEHFNWQYGAYLALAGVQSEMLAWMIKTYGLDIPFATVAAAECPENNRICASLGTNFLRPKMTKREIFIKYGYPIISKEVSMALSRYLRTKSDRVKDYRLNGSVKNGKKLTAGTIPKKYQFLIYAPFETTEKCCDHIKKNPLKKFEKETGLFPITGEMATDSQNRKKQYMKNGCVKASGNHIKCTPLGFWTDDDVKRFIQQNDIQFSAAYGQIINGKFTGEHRTGCEECAFGIMQDPERFKRLKEKSPNKYLFVMGGGEWVEKPLYREVKFSPKDKKPVWSNLYWVPNKAGMGMGYVLDYIKKGLG